MVELLTVKDLEKRLKIFYPTLYKWAREGEIPSIRFGRQVRFDPDAVEAWIRSRSVGVADDRNQA
jgi:excisionase family DNA binding protein